MTRSLKTSNVAANHHQINDRLVSSSFRKWLDAPVFELRNGVSYSRRAIAALTASPCTRAASNLHRACHRYGILTIEQLAHAGFPALARCRGIGERAAWIAALVLAEYGYSIDRWLERPDTGTLQERIKLVHSRSKKQKQ